MENTGKPADDSASRLRRSFQRWSYILISAGKNRSKPCRKRWWRSENIFSDTAGSGDRRATAKELFEIGTIGTIKQVISFEKDFEDSCSRRKLAMLAILVQGAIHEGACGSRATKKGVEKGICRPKRSEI